MSEISKKDVWAELRKPFPAGTVGKLPKPHSKDSAKGKCSECGGWHGLPAVHLDYIGHAAVTDRLNSVDPTWTWEPVSFDAQGLPAIDRDGNLWIRLTINGVTRLGVGDGKNAKERIGDALRNSAMRFGVGLDLWTKDELESTIDHPELKNEKPKETVPGISYDKAPEEPSRQVTDEPISNLTMVKVKQVFRDKNPGLSSTELLNKYMEYSEFIIGKPSPTTEADAKQLLDTLEAK